MCVHDVALNLLFPLCLSLLGKGDSKSRIMGNQLHLACWRDDIETFEKVISFAPGGLKSLDVFGVQPLHVATFKGSLKCLSVILGRQIHGDLDDTFGGGITAFQIAEDASQSFALSLLNDQKGEDHALNIFKLNYYNLMGYHSTIFNYKQSSVYHECLKYETKAKKEGILNCISPKGDINTPLVKGLTHFTPLFLSVMLNDLKGVKKLLARGAVIKDTALSHNNLLCLAARYGYYQLIPILIDAGFSISHEPGAYTPLAVAAQYGSLPCVKAITTRKEYDPTTAGADKALFLTAQNGHFHIISTLVRAGATVNEMYYSGHCKLPLHSASLYDHRATVEKLLEFGANPLSCNKSLHPLCTCTALSYAANAGSCNVVEPLIKAGVSPTKYCEVPSHLSPVVNANIRGFVSFLKVVVDCGFNPNSLGSKGHTPLEDALNFCFEERQKGRPTPLSSRHLELLIDLGCTVDGRNNSSGFEAIHMAAQYNDIEAIKALLKSGVEPNIGTKSESPFTPIHIAAIHNRPEAIQILVDAGANLNAAYTDGAPPLHVAVQFEAINSCKKLLELGANPNTRSTIGMTPLHVAAGSDQADMVDLLFWYGAHLETVFVGTESRSHNVQSNSLWLERCLYPHPDNCTLTPLIIAARFQARSALKKLIELGADVDAQYGHWTPLFAAAVLGFVDIVSDLLNNGANVDKGNTSGTTPLHAAITNCHTEVACILIQRGCDVTQPILQHDKKTPDLNPFQLASLFCQTEILRIIHEKNPNINIHESSHDHLGLLHLALLQPTTEITLPTGPEPNYPLIKATNEEYMKKEEQTVRYLLELGCNVNATDDKGMTPLDMATSYEAEKIAMILVKAGGKRGEHIKDDEELRRHIAKLEDRDRDILHRLSAVENQVKDLQDFKASATQLMEGVLSKCSYVSGMLVYM